MKRLAIGRGFVILFASMMLTACQSASSTKAVGDTSEVTAAGSGEESAPEESKKVSQEESNDNEETSEVLTEAEDVVFTAGDLSIVLPAEYSIRQNPDPGEKSIVLGVSPEDDSQRIILVSLEDEGSYSSDQSREVWTEVAVERMMKDVESTDGTIEVISETELTDIYFADRLWAHKSIAMNIDGAFSAFDIFVTASRKEGLLRSIEIINYAGDNQKLVERIGEVVSISTPRDRTESEIQGDTVDLDDGMIAIGGNYFMDWLEDDAPQSLIYNYRNLHRWLFESDRFEGLDVYIWGRASVDRSGGVKLASVMIGDQNGDTAATVNYFWNEDDELVLYNIQDQALIEQLALLGIMSVDHQISEDDAMTKLVGVMGEQELYLNGARIQYLQDDDALFFVYKQGGRMESSNGK